MNGVNETLQSGLASLQLNRRRRWPPWTKYPAAVLAYLLLRPITKTMELFDRWPRALAQLMARYWGPFGDYQPSEHDVFICSYFKSGTNWAMQIVVQIAHRGRARYQHIHDIVPWPDVMPEHNYAAKLDDESTWRKTPTQLRAIKTHRSFRNVPYSPKARYICVVRDPKDVCVSSFHFMRKTMLGPLMPSMSSWLKTFLSPDTIMGSWAEHLHSCWEVRHRDNVLFLTYEEMAADLPAIVQRIVGFMNVELTTVELAAVIEQSTFSHMKSIDHKFAPTALVFPWVSEKKAMMRRGQRGTASELLSAVDQRRIDDYWRSELVRLGCDFPYDRVYGAQSAEAQSAEAQGAGSGSDR